jgi:ABC-type uncharacterized transport system permease subunit
MSFTVLYAVLTLLALIVIFGVTYKIKGWKIALLVTGLAFVLSVLLLMVLIFVITRNM